MRRVLEIVKLTQEIAASFVLVILSLYMNLFEWMQGFVLLLLFVGQVAIHSQNNLVVF